MEKSRYFDFALDRGNGGANNPKTIRDVKRLRQALRFREWGLPRIQLLGTLRGSQRRGDDFMFHKLSSSAIFRFGFLVAFCLASFVLALSARAQIGNATLGGTVMDPSAPPGRRRTDTSQSSDQLRAKATSMSGANIPFAM